MSHLGHTKIQGFRLCHKVNVHQRIKNHEMIEGRTQGSLQFTISDNIVADGRGCVQSSGINRFRNARAF